MLCMLVYMVSYISRINLGAVMVELVAIEYAPQTVAALALTLCSITYVSTRFISAGAMVLRTIFPPHHSITHTAAAMPFSCDRLKKARCAPSSCSFSSAAPQSA